MSTPLTDPLRPFIDRGWCAGAVVGVADRDRVLAVEAAGKADLAAGTPMRTDALFWIASVTKPVTGALLMMYVDEGKLSLDDAAEKYLPAFGNLRVAGRPPARPVTVRDLMSHASGLPFAAPEEEPYKDLFPPARGVEAYARLALESDPGTVYRYSNAGINSAARIVELVAGEEYEALLQRRLLDPLGMADTVFRPAGERLARLAKIYRAQARGDALEETRVEQLQYPLDAPSRAAMAAGGLFSTAADMLRFGRMILRGGELDGRRYLSEAAVRTMTSRQTGPGLDAAYGVGWGVGEHGYGHGGAARTDFWIDPGLGIVRLFFVQQAGDWPGGDEGQKIKQAYVDAAAAFVGAAPAERDAVTVGTGTPAAR